MRNVGILRYFYNNLALSIIVVRQCVLLLNSLIIYLPLKLDVQLYYRAKTEHCNSFTDTSLKTTNLHK